MPQEVFTAGVGLGGLRTQNDIRILVCYMLNSVPSPLTIDNILEILQDTSLANYFEISDAIHSLIRNDNIKQLENNFLEITETGKEIALTLETFLPLSVRDKAREAAFTLLHHAKIEKENKVEIRKTDNGYNVTCHVSGGNFDLMCLTVYVPDMHQAKMVKKNFHSDPEHFYKLMLTSITGNRDLEKSLL